MSGPPASNLRPSSARRPPVRYQGALQETKDQSFAFTEQKRRAGDPCETAVEARGAPSQISSIMCADELAMAIERCHTSDDPSSEPGHAAPRSHAPPETSYAKPTSRSPITWPYLQIPPSFSNRDELTSRAGARHPYPPPAKSFPDQTPRRSAAAELLDDLNGSAVLEAQVNMELFSGDETARPLEYPQTSSLHAFPGAARTTESILLS
ncbi:hypothetical protein AAL_04539 [Moelleriella libera RCEF 2490]|uniref:Uncharacterized protein n=1 Tax=Moelleriella libera RCEF 2490 TaxID=1081109 RepID=A0A168BHC2_9HYPO|nr:hypothetical protein AAL_04539 [Moelleriella libera RCEF 2490]